jgi:hypothetical protein
MDLSSLLLDLARISVDTVRHGHQHQLLGAELPQSDAVRRQGTGLGFHLPAAGRA